MHRHSSSTDSAHKIRTNPLNITMNDGSDLVFPRKHLYEPFDMSAFENEDLCFDDSQCRPKDKKRRPYSTLVASKSVTDALTANPTETVPASRAEILTAMSPETPAIPAKNERRRVDSGPRPKSEIYTAASSTSSLLDKFNRFAENRHFSGSRPGEPNSLSEKQMLANEARLLAQPERAETRDVAADVASLSISNGTCAVLPKVPSNLSLKTYNLDTNPFTDMQRVYHLQPHKRTLDPASPTKSAFGDDLDDLDGECVFEGDVADGPRHSAAQATETDSAPSTTDLAELHTPLQSPLGSPASSHDSPFKINLALHPTSFKDDFGQMLDMGSFGLSRKNTITSSGASVKTRPSESTDAFKKLKSARSKFGSLRRDQKDALSRNASTQSKHSHYVAPQVHSHGPSSHGPNALLKSAFDTDSSCASSVSEGASAVSEMAPASDAASDAASVVSKASEASFASAVASRSSAAASLSSMASMSSLASTHTLDPNAQVRALAQKKASQSSASLSSATELESPVDDSFDMHIMQQLTEMPTPEFKAMMDSPESVFTAQEGFPSPERPRTAESRSVPAAAAPAAAPEPAPEPKVAPVKPKVAAKASKPVPVAPQLNPEDRGRLFMAIRGIKDIRLPIDHTRHPKYTLTLDNGMQCVTTEPVDLRSSSVIDQEFELIVGADLELVFTLKAAMDPIQRELPPMCGPKEPEVAVQEKPAKTKSPRSAPSTPVKAKSPTMESPKKESTPKLSKGKSFKALFSPKKRREARAMAAVSEEKDGESKKAEKKATKAASPVVAPPPLPVRKHKDLWDHIVGNTGSFGRCYIVESQYEQEIYGRSRTYSVPLYNEWGQEKVLESTHNGKDKYRYKRQEPYRIGALELTLMYIPRVHKFERLPGSMTACAQELEQAKKFREMKMEGFLSQEGGDCAYWRRRWFKLTASTLTGYHEDTMKERCSFDLSQVCDIVELSNPKKGKTGGVHSGLVGGYVLVEGAFRLTFDDDTFVNFYADNEKEKIKWVQILSLAMQNVPGKNRTWTDLVFEAHKREQENSARIKSGWDQQSQNSGFKEGIHS